MELHLQVDHKNIVEYAMSRGAAIHGNGGVGGGGGGNQYLIQIHMKVRTSACLTQHIGRASGDGD